jgi:hypothetical protein
LYGAVVHAEIRFPSHLQIPVAKPPLTSPGPDGENQRAVSTLQIKNVRLEAPPLDAPKPSTLLKFDLLNDGEVSVTDVIIKIAIVENGHSTVESVPRFIAGPFTISGHATIDAGYTVNYEMVLRNLSSDCGCRADVNVVAARSSSDPAR